jgi:hypothetical protein
MTMQTLEPPAVTAGVDEDTCVAKYRSHKDAEAAVRELQAAGVDMKTLSIIGREYQTEEHVLGYYNTGDRMKAWGKRGAFWGGIWGLLFGSAFFLIPGVGPVMIAGPIVAAIISSLEGAAVVGGLSALGAALVSQGIPKDTALSYETDLKAGSFLLIAHGSRAEVARVTALLELTGHQGMTPHAA